MSAAAVEPLCVAQADTALGRWSIAATSRGVCLVVLDAGRAALAMERWCRRWLGARVSTIRGSAADAAARQLVEYARGQRRRFELELDLRGSPFQLAVWGELATLPFGTTLTYGQLAVRLRRPGGSRAVGQAAGANPTPVLVPCHRLLARDGPGGFSAGLELKRRLLVHEGRVWPWQAELPTDGEPA